MTLRKIIRQSLIAHAQMEGVDNPGLALDRGQHMQALVPSMPKHTLQSIWCILFIMMLVCLSEAAPNRRSLSESFHSHLSHSLSLSRRLEAARMLGPACPTSAPTRQTLTDLFVSTGGSDWIDHTNWLSNLTVCSWFGISCSPSCDISVVFPHTNNLNGTLPDSFPMASSQVVGLSIRGEPLLSGTIPSALASSARLQLLAIHNAMVSGTIPPSITKIPTLETLQLEVLPISGSLPEFHAHSNLSELLVSGLQLSSTLPTSIAQLTQLRVISINGLPRVSGTVPSLSQLTRLTTFALYAMPLLSGTFPSFRSDSLQIVGVRDMLLLSGTVPDSVITPTLSTLYIYDVMRVTGSLPPTLSSATALTALGLYTLPKLTGSLPSLSKLASLQTLAIGGLFVSGAIDLALHPAVAGVEISGCPSIALFMNDSYCQLRQIQSFQLSGLPLLSGTLPDCLSELSAMQQMFITDGGLSGTVPASLARLPLSILQIQEQTGISGTLPPAIFDMTSLVQLFMFGNPLVSGTLPSVSRLTRLTMLQISNYPFLSGTMPSLHTLTRLQQVYLYENAVMSGTMPDLNASASLQIISLFRLPLVSGTFPSLHPQNSGVLGIMTSLTPLLSGTIPHTLAQQTSLDLLDIHGSRVSGTLPSLQPGKGFPHMQTLDLSDTRLSGTIDDWVGAASSLAVLSIARCNFSGTIPAMLGSLSKLTELNAEGNSFSGLPRAALQGDSLLTALMSDNLIPFDPTQCLNAVNDSISLSVLSLAGNPLQTTLHKVLECYLNPSMLRLDLHAAGLHGAFDEPADNNFQSNSPEVVSSLSCVLDGILRNAQTSWFQLSSLDISQNQISGVASSQHITCDHTEDFELSNYLPLLSTYKLGDNTLSIEQLPPNLQTLDVTNANLDPCIVPTQLLSPALQNFFAPGVALDSGLRCGRIDYHSLVRPSPDQVTFPSKQLTCPQWLTATSGGRLKVDSSFNGYAGCHCPNGMYFDRPSLQCMQCPERLDCDTAVVNPIHKVKASYYPIFPHNCNHNLQSVCVLHASLERCRGVGICAVEAAASSPSLMPGYHCGPGIDPSSLLCSRCLPNHFKTGDACLECREWFTWFTPLYLLIVVSIYFYYLWRSWLAELTPEGHHNHAVVMITVGWLQLLALLDNNSSFAFVTEAAIFKPWALQCVWAGFDDYHRLILAFLLPLIISGLIVLLWPTVMYLQNALGKTTWTTTECKDIIAMSVVRTAYFLYLPVTVSVFESLNCTRTQVEYEGVTTDVDFLDRVPHIRCHDTVLTPMAIASLLYFVVGLPLVATISMWRQYKRYGAITNFLRFQVESCHPSKWWWPCFIQLRTLVVVGVYYTLPYENNAIPIIIFLMVMVSILLQLTVVPHVRRADNVLSTITLLTLLIEYLATIIDQKPSSNGFSTAEEGLVSSVTILCFILCASFSVRLLRDVVRVRMASYARINAQDTDAHTDLLSGHRLNDTPPSTAPYAEL